MTALILSAPDMLAQPALGSDVVVAILNVNVLPMDTERIALNQTVVVRGSTIASVGPAKDTLAPPGATVIEGHDKYLAPGLADMHVHLADPNDPPGVDPVPRPWSDDGPKHARRP